jgi:hypothetical protein
MFSAVYRCRHQLGGRTLLYSLIFLGLTLTSSAADPQQGREPVARCPNLEVETVRFEPVAAGKNIVEVTVRNLTDRVQAFGIHIQADLAPSGRGWGTVFFEQIAPRARRSCRFAYELLGDPGAESSVRLRFYNPPSREQFAYEQCFHQATRTLAEIGRKTVEAASDLPARCEVADEVLAEFARFQQALRDRRYEDAWHLLTVAHRQAAFQNQPGDGSWYCFKATMNSDLSPERWSRADMIRLRPLKIAMRENVAVVSARLEESDWTVEFAREEGKWRVDWINGRPYLPADRDARIALLLPRLEHRATAHFDVYYAADSLAARDIASISQARESGYDAISEFLGLAVRPRIRLIFFADADAKTAWTLSLGSGFAYGTTVIELYNDDVRLEPIHETTHILSSRVGNPPAIFNEGFAVYMAERLGAPALKYLGGDMKSMYERARELKAAGQWIPLPELVRYTDIGPMESRPTLAYPEAGAFVKFLVETYGKEKFLAAYRDLRNSSDQAVQQQNVAALEEIYGKSIAELNHLWLAAMGIAER